jgi:two-component system, NarL family, invasion response regulator UvrY
MTSVLIIDDHPIVLQGCRRMLEDAGVKTVLEARDVTSGYRLYRRHHPDVVIVDLAMQGGGLRGLDVIRRMRSHEPRTRILVFSMYSDPIVAARALEAGATGYVLKDTSSDELMKAFDQVRTGTPYLSNDLAMQVALVRTGVRTNPLADLTPRELQTLSLLAEGKPYGRIAEELNVSYALGAAAEVRLGGNWTGKIEYLYLDFGKVSTTASLPTNSTPLGINFNSRVADHIVRVGVNYKFDPNEIWAN